MKFIIESLSKTGGRLGQLVQVESAKKFPTPLLLQTTKSGSIPYLSREAFDYVTKDMQVLQMSLDTVDQMAESLKFFNGDFNAYVGYKDYPTVLLLRDPCEITPSGNNERDVMPLFTRRGKEFMSPKRYMELMETFQPDIYQGLSDADTNIDSAKKRVQKSVNRTEKFMDICCELQTQSERLRNSALFVPIVGGYNTYARTECIQHTKSKGEENFGGYILEGFHNNGTTATEVNAEKLIEVVRHCMKEMNTDKPKMMPGAYTPPVIVSLIALGIDIFDTSYAYCAAANYKALVFNYRLDKDGITTPTPFLDLTDECLKEEFVPVMDCGCLACKKYTRAYLHHLYNTKELLGPILLMIHNLHHYMEFFKYIRQIMVDSSALPQLIEYIKYQKTDKEVDYRIDRNTKVISNVSADTNFAAVS